MEVRPMGNELLLVHGGRQTATIKIIVTFRKFAKDVKKRLNQKLFSRQNSGFGVKESSQPKGVKTENKRAETKKWFVYIG